MSDFIYLPPGVEGHDPERHLLDIYPQPKPTTSIFEGDWGTCIASHGPYRGLHPVETDRHVAIVLGGPVLYFRDNSFLAGDDPTEGTRALLERWNGQGLCWENDLSGPFAFVAIDKFTQEVTLVTDLMAFVPLYKTSLGGKMAYASHVDLLARATGQAASWDPVSLGDFLANGIITFPYTAYRNIWQVAPATVTGWVIGSSEQRHHYWLPKDEQLPFNSVKAAAAHLRKGVRDYVTRLTAHMDEVGQFISGGEDSRAVAGLLPERLKRHAYIFVDSMNREARIARRVSKVYGAEFNANYRLRTHYLDILRAAANLVGTGHQYVHAHSLGFHASAGLSGFNAMLGGFSADALLKGLYLRKSSWLNRLHFLPRFHLGGHDRINSPTLLKLPEEIALQIRERRSNHVDYVMDTCGASLVHEWFILWPSSMRQAIPYYYTNRRLLSSFEPFMCNEVVKIVAQTPPEWRINRTLFQTAMKPFLYKSRYISHGDGGFPYLPWQVNTFVRACTLAGRKLRSLAVGKNNEGPWADWKDVQRTDKWRDLVRTVRTSTSDVESELKIETLLQDNSPPFDMMLNLFQISTVLRQGRSR